ncbi:MAG: hypothetical protein V1772_02805, partial [Chloroflexota bacterium]
DLAVLPYPYGYTEVRGQPVDEWLAEQPAGSAIIEYPLEKTWYGWMLYPQRVHGQPMAYGYGTFLPADYRLAATQLARWPDVETLALLRAWGIRYVLMGARSYGARWDAVARDMAALPGVERVAEFEDRPLYHGDRLLRLVRPSAAVPATELVSGERQAFLHDVIVVYAIR